ncbi:hypothetical protein SAY87_010146 [Trapa incisa]|uniref:Uncharacterized protein n=1 Tax=Trapa incisa TaxID=236973 RepID=A0AAN7GTQ1_9MYRT|nr:hypothetical protein SAY87_010146 [Trapa incisa]
MALIWNLWLKTLRSPTLTFEKKSAYNYPTESVRVGQTDRVGGCPSTVQVQGNKADRGEPQRASRVGMEKPREKRRIIKKLRHEIEGLRLNMSGQASKEKSYQGRALSLRM